MTEPEDALSREVAIEAKLDETGVSLRTKSRAIAAIDRLVGSLADIPAAYFEGIAGKRRVRDEIDRRLMEAQAEIAEKKLRGLDIAGDALLLDLLKREARRQANAASVAIEALENMKALAPPIPQTHGPTGEEPAQVDDDWLNQFTRYAEDASSERMQQLWGRVLAGEVERPGRFSRAALRFVAELDKETADNCQFAADRALPGLIPSTSEWDEGQPYLIGLDLQRLGLVGSVGGASENQYNLRDGHLILRNGAHTLLVVGPTGHRVKLKTIIVTRLGREVFSLLTPKDDTLALRNFAKLIGNPPIERIELGTSTPIADDRVHFHKLETLWEEKSSDDNA